jgi:hypothetical protein
MQNDPLSAYKRFYDFLRVTTDGRVYEGNWSNGQAHGKGREVNPDGTVRHDGEWHYDIPVRNR